MILVMILSFIVQTMLKSRFAKYSKVPTTTGLTGAEVARKMLLDNGITDVQVTCIPGQLTDHYNPATHTVNLSDNVFGTNSVAAAAVAAHECGHVIQHQVGYSMLKVRTALVPPVSFASKWVQWVLLAGVLLVEVFPAVLWVGIGLFALTTLFSVVTLPVEVDASRRAIAWLEHSGITTGDTTAYAKDALKAAAYTYVVAAFGSLATLLYYVLMALGRRD